MTGRTSKATNEPPASRLKGVGASRAAASRPARSAARAEAKQPFEVARALALIREEVKEHADAAMFELAARGHRSLFEQLVACILSIRTRDEVSLPAALALLARARTPEQLRRLAPEEIDRIIDTVTFHEPKARQIHEIAVRVVDQLGGELPADAQLLQSFRGVGPKCAHLALGVALGQEHISVDIHVHRVTNRWGYVAARTPERTLAALEQVLPRPFWVEINRLLVPFGKHVCTGVRPRCSSCPVLEMCQQVGVTEHR